MTRKNARQKPEKSSGGKQPAHESAPNAGKKTQARVKAHQSAFLAAYLQCGSVRKACLISGVGRRTHYDWLDNNVSYRQRFEDTCTDYLDSLVEEIDRRAVRGVESIIPGKDGPIIKTEFSDSLLMFRVKKLDNSYRERFSGELHVKQDYDAGAMAKLTATPEGRALVRQMSAMMEGNEKA